MSADLRRWIPHLVCLVVVLVECAAWAVLHRSEAELEAAAASGDARARVTALHILTNRGEPAPERFDAAFATSLLGAEDELLQDYAFTTDVTKHANPRAQYLELKSLIEQPADPAFWRRFILHRRKIGVVTGGSSARLKLQELDWYLEALAGRPLPADEVLSYIQANP